MNPPAQLFMYSGTCGSTMLTLPHGDGLGLRGEGQLVVDVGAGTVTLRGGVPPRRRYSEWLPYSLRTTAGGRLRRMMTQNPDEDARFSFPLGDVGGVRRNGTSVEFDVTHGGGRRTARFNGRTEAHAEEIVTLLRQEPLAAGIAAGAAEGHGLERFQLVPGPDTSTQAYAGVSAVRYAAITFAVIVVAWLVSRPLELAAPGRTKPDPVFVRNVDRAVRAWRFAPEAEPWTGSIDFTIEPALDKAAAKLSRF